MKNFFLSLCAAIVSLSMVAGENDLLWDYTNANIPSSGPDNGLYYAGYVNDAAGTNLGLHGVKLNSSGYAYFEKAAVAGKLKLIISDRKSASTAFKVDVFNATRDGSTITPGTLIATSEEVMGPTEVTINLDETVTGVYIKRNAANEGVLCKVQFTETVARTFVDFKVDFRTNPYTVVMPTTGLPEGVTIEDAAYFDAQHGHQNAVVTVPVDGPVKFTIGGCGFTTKATVTVGGKTTDIDSKTPGCDNGFGTYTKFATWTYNVEAPDTLTFNLGKFCPYFFAEACEYVKDVVVSYYDQNDVKLGADTVAPGSAFSAKYGAEDLTIPTGYAFRGWFNTQGMKIAEGEILDADIRLTAKVTAIETAATGTHYRYETTKTNFYIEDHENIVLNGTNYDLTVSASAYVIADGVSTYHSGETTVSVPATTKVIDIYNTTGAITKVGHLFDIPAGDAAGFLMACSQLADGDTIQLHDGTYDLGETVLTTISKNNVVLRGESMDSTIIYNAPDAKTEGIGTTATIVNTGSDNVFEYLTLQNGLDYYKNNNGRAVCLQDKGTRTACYSVKMLSYQDTYYSNKPGQQCWFEDCEIHGTVDYICGSGSVYFYNTLLYCEKRNATGGGADCLTANNSQTAQQDKGYVFDRCTIQSECPVLSLGRAWNDQPMVAYLLTTLDMSAGDFTLTDNKSIYRWTKEGMNVVAYDFAEYNTMDVEGNVISPASNLLTFTYKETSKQMETIIDYTAAEAKSYTHFFRDGWDPARNYVAFPIPTAVEENATAKLSAKCLVNGRLMIKRGDRTYDALGR